MRLIAFVLLSISAFAACKPDPNIDREFTLAHRVQLPARLPKQVFDGRKTYTVQMATKASMPDYNAITNYDPPIILLAEGLKDERETFYHELTHIAARTKESWYNPCAKRTEDDAIELFSPGMVEILRRNPAVVAFLLGK